MGRRLLQAGEVCETVTEEIRLLPNRTTRLGRLKAGQRGSEPSNQRVLTATRTGVWTSGGALRI
jgi:hypothetical protein